MDYPILLPDCLVGADGLRAPGQDRPVEGVAPAQGPGRGRGQGRGRFCRPLEGCVVAPASFLLK